MKRLMAILSFLMILTAFFPKEANADKEMWDPQEKRSVSLFLTIRENGLHIYSDKQWDDVHVQLFAPDGTVFCADHVTLHAGGETIVPVPNLPEGAYQVILTWNNFPVTWYLFK